MSQVNISIPITVEHVGNSHTLEPAWKEIADIYPNTEVFVHGVGTKDDYRGPFDPWQLREDFLSCPPDQWKDFIAKTGLFTRPIVSQGLFKNWQVQLREALVRPARELRTLLIKNDVEGGSSALHTFRKLRISWGGETPRLFIRSESTLEVIIATIHIDKLRGAEFKVCARHDCKNPPFKVEARQKIFCSSDCAHLVAVRRSRERAANGKSKPTKQARRGKQQG